jgi:hypothetical protein
MRDRLTACLAQCQIEVNRAVLRCSQDLYAEITLTRLVDFNDSNLIVIIIRDADTCSQQVRRIGKGSISTLLHLDGLHAARNDRPESDN